MIDTALVNKKLAFIETCVRELRELAQPDLFQTDVREERFVLHTLQIAIQAILDVASHTVSDERLGEPLTNAELFDILEKHNKLDPVLAETMRSVVGFRNIVVHGYQVVDPKVVVDIINNKLEDLLEFVKQIRELG